MPSGHTHACTLHSLLSFLILWPDFDFISKKFKSLGPDRVGSEMDKKGEFAHTSSVPADDDEEN